jgi:pantoate--beta-alanine ligase
MREATTIAELRSAVDEARAGGAVVGFVPTMGSLHEGHLSLLRLARARADRVVLSIFVNPTQFGPSEDLAAYPRDLEGDRRAAESVGTDLLFRPEVSEMYPEGFRTRVRVEGLSEPMCGRDRPGHFDGVALVVAKLLNAVRPDFSVFGRKDAQQALVVRRLARDLALPGEIVLGPTVREPDGLAMSSRNRYLSGDERRAAPALSRGLFAAARAWAAGERNPVALVGLVRAAIDAEPLLAADYVEIRDRENLEPWGGGDAPALLAGAVRVGRARLIDNVFLGGPDADEVPAAPAVPDGGTG